MSTDYYEALHNETNETLLNEFVYCREEILTTQTKLRPFFESAAPKWEYLVLEDITEEDLDDRGARGWELVSCTSYQVGRTLGGSGGEFGSYKVHMRYVFKRPNAALAEASAAELQEELAVLRKRKGELLLEMNARSMRIPGG